jgi:hypothetical protein
LLRPQAAPSIVVAQGVSTVALVARPNLRFPFSGVGQTMTGRAVFGRRCFARFFAAHFKRIWHLMVY